jgi:hypothetical protein
MNALVVFTPLIEFIIRKFINKYVKLLVFRNGKWENSVFTSFKNIKPGINYRIAILNQHLCSVYLFQKNN